MGNTQICKHTKLFIQRKIHNNNNNNKNIYIVPQPHVVSKNKQTLIVNITERM